MNDASVVDVRFLLGSTNGRAGIFEIAGVGRFVSVLSGSVQPLPPASLTWTDFTKAFVDASGNVLYPHGSSTTEYEQFPMHPYFPGVAATLDESTSSTRAYVVDTMSSLQMFSTYYVPGKCAMMVFASPDGATRTWVFVRLERLNQYPFRETYANDAVILKRASASTPFLGMRFEPSGLATLGTLPSSNDEVVEWKILENGVFQVVTNRRITYRVSVVDLVLRNEGLREVAATDWVNLVLPDGEPAAFPIVRGLPFPVRQDQQNAAILATLRQRVGTDKLQLTGGALPTDVPPPATPGDGAAPPRPNGSRPWGRSISVLRFRLT